MTAPAEVEYFAPGETIPDRAPAPPLARARAQAGRLRVGPSVGWTLGALAGLALGSAIRDVFEGDPLAETLIAGLTGAPRPARNKPRKGRRP